MRGDFYDIPSDVPCDLITYFDVFGIGDDRSPRQLLDHLAERLTAGGRVQVEISDPEFWAERAGPTMQLGSATRTDDFDSTNQQLVDTWTGPSEEMRRSDRWWH